MKIALIQFNASGDKKKNLSRAKEFVVQAIGQKAQWILLPEIFNFRGDLRNKETLQHNRETIPGSTSNDFLKLAQKQNVNILLGSILEKAQGHKVYNSSIAINGQDGSITKYRKIHLFEAILGDKIIRESDCMAKGGQTQMVMVGEFKVGLSVCYDLRFPALYQEYAKKGATVLTVPSCFTKITGQAHWETLLRARAIENLCYVLAPNQVGMDARGVEAFGHSMVVDPWGKIVACGSADQEEIIYADISPERIKEARGKLPGLFPPKADPPLAEKDRR